MEFLFKFVYGSMIISLNFHEIVGTKTFLTGSSFWLFIFLWYQYDNFIIIWIILIIYQNVNLGFLNPPNNKWNNYFLKKKPGSYRSLGELWNKQKVAATCMGHKSSGTKFEKSAQPWHKGFRYYFIFCSLFCKKRQIT